jgi:hypothetical protein
MGERTPMQRAAASVSRALTDEGLMSQARQILATHGARHMRLYDSKCITDL